MTASERFLIALADGGLLLLQRKGSERIRSRRDARRIAPDQLSLVRRTGPNQLSAVSARGDGAAAIARVDDGAIHLSGLPVRASARA